MIVCINLVFSKTMRFGFTAVIFTFISVAMAGGKGFFHDADPKVVGVNPLLLGTLRNSVLR